MDIVSGELGNTFYMIQKGEAIVHVGMQTIKSIKPGDYFGERALMSNQLRVATVTNPTP